MKIKETFTKLQNFLSKNRKKILIASMLAVAIGVPTILSMRAREVRSWYDEDWELRIPITISYSGSTLTDYDVLVELDTEDLISNSKLQSDCDDIRFVDSDDTTPLDYWIEGGCDTANTQIWVRVPSIPDGGKDIHLYYDNSSATNAQESWSGEFTVMSTASCSAGWTRNSSLDDKFVRGAATHGGTGGAASHSHNQVACTGSAGAQGAAGVNSVYGGPDGWLYTHRNHTHGADGLKSNISSTDNSPPYLNTVYCSTQDLYLPAGSIAMFDNSSPDGWTRVSALDDRFPRGAEMYGGTGGAATHTHVAPGGIGTPSSEVHNSYYLHPGGGDSLGSHSHTTLSTVTGAGTSLPPYLDVVYSSIDDSGPISQGAIMIVDSLPPLGWGRVSAFDNRFPRGAETYGGTGGAATHSHSVTLSTTTASSPWVSRVQNSGNWGSGQHSHSCSTTTNSVDHTPPYFNVIFVKKNSPIATTSLGEEESQNVSPNTPSLNSPSDEALSIGLTPQLKTTTTDPENDYIRYRIQLCENEDMDLNCQNFNQSDSQTGWSGQNAQTNTAYTSGTQATYTIQTPLELSTTYYWRSYAIDPGGKNQESETQSSPYSFTTSATPAIPTLNSPANSSTNQSVTPQLKMVTTDLDNDYIRFRVEVCTDYNMTTNCNTHDQTISQAGWSGQNTQAGTAYTSSTEATYTIQTALNTETTYYWRSSAIDPGGTNIFSDTSLIRSFTTTKAPNAPTSLETEEAVNPIQVEDITPEFSAIHTDPDGDAATAYRIQVNTASDFTGTMMWESNKQNMSSTSHSNRSPEIPYAGTTLAKDGTKYYWRIKFFDSKNAESSWSQVANFTMWRLPIPGGCHLVKANDNSQITINWVDTNTTEDGYRIERKVNAGSFTLLTTKAANSVTHDDSTVSNGNTYQYRIAATLGSDLSPWCTTNIVNLQLNHFLIL